MGRAAPQAAEHGVVAHRHAQAGQDPLGRAPTCTMAEKQSAVRQAPCLPKPRLGGAQLRLGKDLPIAATVPAFQPGDLELGRDPSTLKGEVLQTPHGVAMAGVGRSATAWAGPMACPHRTDDPPLATALNPRIRTPSSGASNILSLIAPARASRALGQPRFQDRKGGRTSIGRTGSRGTSLPTCGPAPTGPLPARNSSGPYSAGSRRTSFCTPPSGTPRGLSAGNADDAGG
mgnify:CR=1 FL=1